jgi:hypothetical protein
MGERKDNMNKMMVFAENRTTGFFRDYAIMQIKIAFRIMEYLAPDDVFPPQIINKHILELILRNNFEDAYANIIEEIQINTPNSSWACEELKSDAVELMQHLKPKYEEQCKDTKEKRKIELLKELTNLIRISDLCVKNYPL